jgi:hypothetical protein
MEATWLHQIEQWHEFFLLSGTAAVTLTGALFVVISLGPSIIAAENNTGVRAFISPNAVYFTTVLVVSHGLLTAALPQALTAWLLIVGALACIIYLISTRSMRRWKENKLSVLDWIWYIALPYLAYLLTLLGGIGVLRNDGRALPAIAATMVFLLVIGIRNAWDLAVWMPMQERLPPDSRTGSGNPTAPPAPPSTKQ